MIHNGIEYGLMQAYAEGFEILKRSRYELDRTQIADLWNQGSVVRSWLLELAERALSETRSSKRITRFRGRTRARGAGRSPRRSTWTCPRR